MLTGTKEEKELLKVKKLFKKNLNNISQVDSNTKYNNNSISVEKYDNLGVVEIISLFGMKIKVYDVERTICDIIKNKNKIDAEIFTKSLKAYAKRKIRI